MSKFKEMLGIVLSLEGSIAVGVITKRFVELEESDLFEPLKEGRLEDDVDREFAVEFLVLDRERDLLRCTSECVISIAIYGDRDRADGTEKVGTDCGGYRGEDLDASDGYLRCWMHGCRNM